jgi:hypothetical protein
VCGYTLQTTPNELTDEEQEKKIAHTHKHVRKQQTAKASMLSSEKQWKPKEADRVSVREGGREREEESEKEKEKELEGAISQNAQRTPLGPQQ